jgi:hypothetical protein
MMTEPEKISVEQQGSDEVNGSGQSLDHGLVSTESAKSEARAKEDSVIS